MTLCCGLHLCKSTSDPVPSIPHSMSVSSCQFFHHRWVCFVSGPNWMPLGFWGWKTLWKCRILLCSHGISAAREGMSCLPVTHAYMMHPQPFQQPSKFVLFCFFPESGWTVLALIRLKAFEPWPSSLHRQRASLLLASRVNNIHLSPTRYFWDSLQGTTCFSVNISDENSLFF